MAKRPTVEVDEDYLKEIMAGGTLQTRKGPTKSINIQQPVKEEEKESDVQPVETAKPVRKKREAQDYEVAFLQRKAGVPRRQTYISSSLYEKINSFLPVIAGGLSITAYLDNILTHHLEQYKDDINELYERKSQKPF